MRAMLLAALAAAVMATAPSARAETCFKSGEEAGALGTVCTYRCSFGETSQNVGPGRMCPATAPASPTALNRAVPAARGGACLKTGERVTGMSKQCLYDCAGSPKAETVGAAQLCPLTVR